LLRQVALRTHINRILSEIDVDLTFLSNISDEIDAQVPCTSVVYLLPSLNTPGSASLKGLRVWLSKTN
jgi:hypothetical protein